MCNIQSMCMADFVTRALICAPSWRCGGGDWGIDAKISCQIIISVKRREQAHNGIILVLKSNFSQNPTPPIFCVLGTIVEPEAPENKGGRGRVVGEILMPAVNRNPLREQ
ncbi:hypothetical protein AB205_0192830 [Aquarana catesbeiana]|uniref:Uncharacterized protein n=1 Tax=Aquarana catesbeiana TaxID=8400 RepID=A0A2G9RJ08_AQUCT|nr:hypothetical protein AB205_0192830 [Aquarana catesbeiana]